jgi:hypothetical protein
MPMCVPRQRHRLTAVSRFSLQLSRPPAANPAEAARFVARQSFLMQITKSNREPRHTFSPPPVEHLYSYKYLAVPKP